MKFESLNIVKYGKFQNAKISGLAPFTIIHGPNEAGKSTLRRMLRDFLFGFPVARTNHPYSFNGMEASAKVTLSDDVNLGIYRKRSTSSFVEFTGGAMTRDAWAALLGGLDDTTYARLLCCSGLEMNGTAEALQNGEFLQSVRSDITGGLRDDKAILEALTEKVKEFGGKKHRKLNDLEALKETVTKASLAWKDMSSWTSQLEDLERAHEDARGVLKLKASLKTRLDSLVELSEALETRDRLEASLRNSGAPVDFPARAREIWNGLELKRKTQEKKLSDLEVEIDELVKELAGIANPNPALLSAGSILQALQGNRKSTETILGSLPKHRIEQATVRKEIADLLNNHLPGVSLEAWLGMAFTGSAKAELESHWDAVEERKSECHRIGTELKGHRKTLDSLRPPEIVTEADRQLAALWSAESSEIIQASKEEAKAKAEVEAHDRAFRRHRTAVVLAGMPDLEMLMTMPLPQESDVMRLGQAWIDARDAVENNREETADLETALAELTEDVEVVPLTREQRDEWRSRRDQCWNAIRARFVEGAPDLPAEAILELEPEQTLADEFKEALDQADVVADGLLEQDADAARILELQSQIQAFESTHTDLEEQQAQALAAWTKLWKSAKFVPGENPESGLEWFKARMEANDSWAELVTAKAKLESSQALLKVFAVKVADVVQLPSLATGNAIEQAKEAVDRIKSLESSIKRHEQENSKLTALVANEQEDLVEATKAMEVAEADWKAAFSELFPSLTVPTNPTTFLEALEELVDQVKELGKLDATIAAQEQELEKVAVEIAPVLKALNTGEMGAKGLSKLLDLWSQAEKDLAERTKASAKLEATRNMVEEVKSQNASVQKDAEALLEESGCIETVDFLARLKAWEDTAEDRSRLRTCRGRIELSDKVLQEEAATQGNQQWSQDREALVEEIEILTSQIDERSQEIGKLKKELQTKEAGNLEALDAKLALARKTTELNAQARAHLRNSLAKIVLEKARESFTSSHTPALQTWAGEYLSTMTEGQWASIDLSDESTLKIGNESGALREETELSTGTADQVRLSIRMAVARHWAESHEPLPFILDDVLVHTDDERMPRAMDALLELSKTTQVLYFTCHESVKEWGETHGATVVTVA